VSEWILIADDSLAARESAQRALAVRGARIELACDGADARARLREGRPDLLIADVHMPGLDGYSLCREAKGEQSDLRVLLLVGTFEPFDAGAASSARADGVLRKPFLADELLRKVEDLLGPVVAEPAVRVSPHDEPAAPAQDALVESGVSSDEGAEESGDAARVELSDADVDRIARRVLELGGGAVLERVARELLGRAVAERDHHASRGAAEPEPLGPRSWSGDPERE